MSDQTDKYFIVCTRHMNRKDYAVLLWGKDKCGYTCSLEKAGRYSIDELQEFIGRKDDFVVPCSEIEAISVLVQYRIEGDNWNTRRIVRNDELFWECYGVDPKKLHYIRGSRGDAYLYRYPQAENVRKE